MQPRCCPCISSPEIAVEKLGEAAVGYWATLSLNIPDFTRYAKSQRSQMLGQALGLPTTMTAFAFIGVAVTSRICLGRDGAVIARLPFEKILTSWALFYRALRRHLPDVSKKMLTQTLRALEEHDALDLGDVAHALQRAAAHVQSAGRDEIDGRVWIIALRDIAAGEELTYDYNLYDGDEDDDSPCLCGARNCRRSLYSPDELERRATSATDSEKAAS